MVEVATTVAVDVNIPSVAFVRAFLLQLFDDPRWRGSCIACHKKFWISRGSISWSRPAAVHSQRFGAPVSPRRCNLVRSCSLSNLIFTVPADCVCSLGAIPVQVRRYLRSLSRRLCSRLSNARRVAWAELASGVWRPLYQ